MTLATHVVVAAGASLPFAGNIFLSFIAGWVSHYFVDAIPHWNLTPNSIKEKGNGWINAELVRTKEAIAKDFLMAGADAFIGVFAVALILVFSGRYDLSLAMLAAAIGGVLPDFLQFVYFVLKKQPFVLHQKFHQWMHTDLKIPEQAVVKGILLQAPVFLAPLLLLVFFL